PGDGVGCKKVSVPAHRTLPRGLISDSMAWAWSTSRCRVSSRYRDQQTRNAKQENASQLMSSTCSMRGSMDPPPPITGCGCWVRKNQIEKYTNGTHSAPRTARAAASKGVSPLDEKRRRKR